VGLQLLWSDSFYPSVSNVELLEGVRCAGLARMVPEARHWLFYNETALTEVERGDGVLLDVQRAGGRAGAILSTKKLVRIFSTQIMPAQLELSARVCYWSVWRQGVEHEECTERDRASAQAGWDGAAARGAAGVQADNEGGLFGQRDTVETSLLSGRITCGS